jgi:hypothetical protein
VESLKRYAGTFSDTCAYLKNYNQWLDELQIIQTPRDERLTLSAMRNEHEQMKKFLSERANAIFAVSLPFEIQWNTYEKIRMRSDDDLRNTNEQLTGVLGKDPGLLMGYQLATRMLQK